MQQRHDAVDSLPRRGSDRESIIVTVDDELEKGAVEVTLARGHQMSDPDVRGKVELGIGGYREVLRHIHDVTAVGCRRSGQPRLLAAR